MVNDFSFFIQHRNKFAVQKINKAQTISLCVHSYNADFRIDMSGSKIDLCHIIFSLLSECRFEIKVVPKTLSRTSRKVSSLLLSLFSFNENCTHYFHSQPCECSLSE